MKRNRWIINGVVLLLIALTGCQKATKSYEQPVYPGFTFPGSITASFPAPKAEGAKQLPTLNFHIDNRKMRIWNKTPLPYQSTYDSLTLAMVVTSESRITILNEVTNKETVYNPKEDKQKIDATGGKLKITIAIEKRPTLTYQLRIMTYGYNPDKFTWTKENKELPVAAEEAQLFKMNGKQYWLARTSDGKCHLYTYAQGAFTEIKGAKLPDNLKPNTLVTHRGGTSVLDNSGNLFDSSDLVTWEPHNTNGVTLTQLVGETTRVDGEVVFNAIGKEGETYASYRITAEGVEKEKGATLPSSFPVTDAYIYTYRYATATSSTIFGGKTADGPAATKSYFLSGSNQWSITPYQKTNQPLPMSGGLFLQSEEEGELFVIGGSYPTAAESNTIKRSSDRGITWNDLPEQELPTGAFLARTSASGFSKGIGKQLEIFVFGGIIGGEPSREIWHGHLDTTGGIINSWE